MASSSALPKAVVIGASSGIGRALAFELSRAGYRLGLTARRLPLLEEIRTQIGAGCEVRRMDVSNASEAPGILQEIVSALGGLDLLVLNAGINPDNPAGLCEPELRTVETNVLGFVALAQEGMRIFEKQGHGHLAGISSIAGLRGSPRCPAYSASKAFVSNYLEALRLKNACPAIHVTDIRPGFVDTAMIAGSRQKFWVASPEKAAVQIASAIRRKKKVAYVTTRYGFLAPVYRRVPDFLLRLAFGIRRRSS